MTKPTIHDNGTPARLLVQTYGNAHDALSHALDVMKGTAPDARDYASPEALDRAWDEHRDRMARVAGTMMQYDDLIGHCEGRG